MINSFRDGSYIVTSNILGTLTQVNLEELISGKN